MIHPSEIKRAFEAGTNITTLLREHRAEAENSTESIETAYDLQAGRYIVALDDPAFLDRKRRYGEALASEIERLTTPGSVLEAGIGEGTTCTFVLEALRERPEWVQGFDISWSRVAYCREWLRGRGQGHVRLDVARLDHMPYADDSFDVVYTSHTIEPNGGRERCMLRELYRVASRYLVLLEPGFELASSEARERMGRFGYCRALVATAESEGMRVLKHELFPHSANPMNPTAITVIEKSPDAEPARPSYACPVFGDALAEHADSFHSEGSLRAYPMLLGIPCLRPEDAVIASAYERFARDVDGRARPG